MDIKGLDKKELKSKFKTYAPAMEAVAKGAIGFLLSRGLVFAEYAPFGIAWCAAGGTWGTIGAILGYISILYKANGLKYMAICILIYTAEYIFRDTSIIKNRAFMPLATLICTASIGFVFVLDSTNPIRMAAFYIAEVFLATLCAHFYGVVLKSKNERRRKAGGVLLVITMIMPLCAIKILTLSIGKILGSTFVLICAYFGGIGAGCAAGITMSFAMMGESYAAIYGMCGLISSWFRNRGQAIYAVSFATVGIAATLWVTMGITLTFVLELGISSTLFLIVVKLWGEKVEKLFDIKEKVKVYNRMQKYIEERLNTASRAFYELSQIFNGSKTKERESLASVFDAPIQKVCKKCMLYKTCWGPEFAKTKDTINFVVDALQNKSRIEKSDFPAHFSVRCIKTDDFIRETNDELFKVLYRKKHKAQIAESRGILKKQYSEMAKIIDGLKNELNLTPDEKYAAKIADFFEKNEITAYPTVYRDAQNHIKIQIEGERLSRLCCEEFSEDLSDFLGFKVTVPVLCCNDGSVSLRQKETLKATMGAAFNKKKGNRVCGDAGSYYRTEDGNMALVLADGMGSGELAAYAASKTINMVERFHRAGIDMNLSLSIINSALTLEAEESRAFTTIDFMELNLYNGKAKLFKYGSAPTYIRHNGKVRKINASSLPAGVPAPGRPAAEHFDAQVYPGDFIVFITDGVVDSNEDAWLKEIIIGYDGKSPRELAGEIIASSSAKYESDDDMTVIVSYVDKNF